MKQEVASAEYKVVVNIEGQYSIWRVHRSNPDGWKDGGFFGPKDDCLNFIRALL